MLNEDTKQNKIINAALKRAEEETWSNISIEDIAQDAGVGLAEVRDYFSSKKDILRAFSKCIDVAVLKIIESDAEPDDVSRDRLFDVLMTRLEVMAPYRLALQKILSDIRQGRGAENLSLRQLWGSNQWMLTAAGISTSGNRGILRNTGLSAIYLRVLPVWFEDEDPGLAKTMATLDKALRDGEKMLKRVDKIAGTGGKILCGLKRVFRKTRGEKKSEQQQEEKGTSEKGVNAVQT